MRSIFDCLVVLVCSTALGNELYQSAGEIPIGGEGGWDILTIDPTANRLYLSHATKVVVVDLGKNSVIGEITDTPGFHAFVAVPALQRGFSSNGKEAKASVVDLRTLKTISKIDTGQSPDAIVYEPKYREVYIFNHSGNSCTVIDAQTATVSTTIQRSEKPELAFPSCGDGTTTIGKNDTPDKRTVVQVLRTERGARTMALDAQTHRIYLPTAQFAPAPSPSPGGSPARPSIVPNTLKLLVYTSGGPIKD